jgi:ATP-dependent DNA helicase RecQ
MFRFEEFVRNFKLPATESLHALKALEQDGWFDFNERNFTSSTVVFNTNKQNLYAFQKSHPEHEALLTTLLRTYEGIFDFPAFISESFIAKLIRKEEAELHLQLQNIAAFGIIQYIPRNDEPQLIFRKHRVPAEELTFNLMQYYKRRDVFIQRTNKMIEYITTKECRSKMISQYFGDATAKTCGVCDNCLRKKKSELTPAEFDSISSTIVSKVSASALTIEKLLKELAPIQKEKAWKVIQFLQAERKLSIDQNQQLQIIS